jgi:hypothetical protein
MCTPRDSPGETLVRDGQTETTIPDNDPQFKDKGANGDYLYGMHEPYSFYAECKARERNQGIFIADQNVGQRAINTRQNRNGNRFGFECPEERDYYPYFHPAPWKDIAILTSDPERCSYFQAESQNVKPKGKCSIPLHNNPQACESHEGVWTEMPAWNIDEPECLEAPWSRDNHLGNGMGGFANTYNWTLPTQEVEPCIEGDNCNCVFRLRYNMSTDDYPGHAPGLFMDSRQNGKNSPIKQDPYVDVEDIQLSLALNTDQYGRTFEDRSHVFHIRPRPDGMTSTVPIYNINVRGKRGNIVQVYPAVEYDFVPVDLGVVAGDYVHFQWTGCDTNPAGNAGEGTDKTDRSNCVQMMDLKKKFPFQ